MYTWRNIVGVGIAFMLILTGVRASLMAQSSEGPGCRVDPANPSIGTKPGQGHGATKIIARWW
jgi:hypothetical protein